MARNLHRYNDLIFDVDQSGKGCNLRGGRSLQLRQFLTGLTAKDILSTALLPVAALSSSLRCHLCAHSNVPHIYTTEM